MKKQHRVYHQTRETLLVKFFFVLAVTAVLLTIGGVYTYMWHLSISEMPPAPIETDVAPATEEEVEARVDIPLSREMNLCGISLTLPNIGLSAIVKNIGENMLEPGLCSYVSGPLRRFRVLVVDTDTLSPTSYWQDKKAAFERYLKTGKAEEIKSIAATDLLSTGIGNRLLYTKLASNSIGYTAEIFQDLPGNGVYQTATYLGGRYVVYITYGLFDNTEDAWNLYFNKNYHAEIDEANAADLFKAYMKAYIARPEIKLLITELNAGTKTITVAN